METSLEKFKQDIETYFAHKPNENILISYWETTPHIEGNDEVIHIGITKFDLSEKEIEKLPSELHGVKCVYEYGSKITFLETQSIGISQILNSSLQGANEVWDTPRVKYDPLIGGVSIGAIDITAGTLANVVWDKVTGEPYLLTNEHVVSNIQNIEPTHPPKDHPIVQPGVVDGGTIDDLAGNLHVVGGMKSAGLNNESHNIDAALITPARAYTIDRFWGIGNIELKNHVEAEVGDTIIKTGRTTGITTANVHAVGVSANIGGIAWRDPMVMTDLIHTKPGNSFVQGGDSGSRAWKEDTMEPVGIVFAGGLYDSFIIRAQNICDAFNVTFEGPGSSGIEIEIDNKVLTTDDLGQASILLTPDQYLYAISKAQYVSEEDLIYIVDEPTYRTITLLKDRYTVTFTVTEYGSGIELEDVDIIVGNESIVTNSQGEAIFTLPWRDFNYTWIATKEYYITETDTFSITNTHINIPVVLKRYGVLSLTSPTVLHQGDDTVEFVFTLEGATFNSNVTDVDNWNIDSGETGLMVQGIELMSDQTVKIDTIGIASKGSITFQVLNNAMDVTLDSSIVFLNITTGLVLFDVSHGETKLHNANVTLAGYGTEITDSDGKAVFEPVNSGTHPWEVTRTGFITKNGELTLSNEHLTEEYSCNKNNFRLRFDGFFNSAWQEVVFKGNHEIIGVYMPVANRGNYTVVIYSADGETLLHSYDQGYLEPTHTSQGNNPYIHFCKIPTLSVVDGTTYRVGFLFDPAVWVVLAHHYTWSQTRPEPKRSFNGSIWAAPNGLVWVDGDLKFTGSTSTKFVLAMGFITNKMEKEIFVNMDI